MLRLLDTLLTSAPVGQIIDSVRSHRTTCVSGLAGSLYALVAAAVHQRLGDPLLVVLEDRTEADSTYADLVTVIGADNVLLYQEEHHSRAALRSSVDADVVTLTETLKRLSENPNRVVVTDVESLVEHVPPPPRISGSLVELRRGDELPFEAFGRQLALGGFERVDFVQSVGEFAVRGGIVDLFPVGTDGPIRLEFFGNEIDSIREFDPMSQRSMRELPGVTVLTQLFHSDQPDALTATLVDHLPNSTISVLQEPDRIMAALQQLGAERVAERIVSWRRLLHSAMHDAGQPIVRVEGQQQPPFHASMRELVRGLDDLARDGYKITLVADGPDAMRRLKELIEGEIDRADAEGEGYESGDAGVEYEPETLSGGFVIPSLNIAVLTEHEIFNRRRARVRRSTKQFKGFTLRELRQLRPGDFVVHVDKGIGRFVGLETIQAAGSRGEAVKLEYAAGGILFVNLNYINRLQKYSSKEGGQPKLSRLGTEEWERTKSRAKRRVKDIARELIKLYAMRKSQPGYAFAEDTQWQRELEASFMYDDTPDQARTTFEVKRDMEVSIPMDRLVCGDVGFGKTEVAVRAAFKAVQSGKQVALLSPTTILAQQHYNTFRDRLSRYAVNVDLLSRFRSKQQQTETLDRLKVGAVDILIGTHRILSKDVRFKDLGLLIIDEEQRFGVTAKEKLRQIRASIDTLTLTATPIPRTLNFSLLGARDLSVIETPPRNRLPITTELITWNDDVLREALRRELDRNGQCFVVHWRISDIDDLAGKIGALVPDARVDVVHGEMTAEQIEKTMLSFIERRSDILVATKIIESGIDIPAVNTIVINRADTFGLAELYQLRGRVGRSNIQAYCFLVVPPTTGMTRQALRRIQAIQELTELGSGLKLAMRDLEIRGAGNLLGAEQSGFIEEVGFELYQKIVDEAVGELKKDEFRDLFRDALEREERSVDLPLNEEITVEIEGDALIPKAYISDDAERYDMYLKMYTAASQEALRTVLSELRDRFGPIPEETDRLADGIRLRLASMRTGAARVAFRDGELRVELPGEGNSDFYERWFQPLMEAVGSNARARLETKGKALAVRFQRVHTIDEAEQMLSSLVEAMRKVRLKEISVAT